MRGQTHTCSRCSRAVVCDSVGWLCPWKYGETDDLCDACYADTESDLAATAAFDAPLLALLHVPKAAGSTLRAVAARQYRKRTEVLVLPKRNVLAGVTSLTPRREARLKILCEVPFVGVHSLLRRPVRYLAMLRHPVDRVISFYFYKKAKGGRGFESVARQRDNTQTRILAGMGSYSGFRSRVTAGALDAAKANLLERFDLIMLLERYDESMVLARRRLGWRRVLLSPRNVTARPAGARVSAHFRQRIASDNVYDMELYAFARERFDMMVAAEGPSFSLECEAFRKLNATNQGIRTQNLPNAAYSARIPAVLSAFAAEHGADIESRRYQEFAAYLRELCAWERRSGSSQPVA